MSWPDDVPAAVDPRPPPSRPADMLVDALAYGRVPRTERLVQVGRQIPQTEADFTPTPAEPHAAVPPRRLDAVAAGAFGCHAAHRDRQLGLEAHVEPVAEVLAPAHTDVRACRLRPRTPRLVDVGGRVRAPADVAAADRATAAGRRPTRIRTCRLCALDGHAQPAVDLDAAARLCQRDCRRSERGRDSYRHHFLLH